MLSTAKPTLQNSINSILEKAAYEAYMTQYEPNQVSQASNYDSEIKSELEKKADDFSKKFATKASGPVATAIHDFVKEIGIQINTVPPSVIAPSGPVTGTIPMTSFTIL